MSIRLRLTAWYTCILAVTLILFGSAVYGVVHFYTFSKVKSNLEEQSKQIQPNLVLYISQGELKFDIGGLSATSGFQSSQIFGQLHDYNNNRDLITENLGRMKKTFPVPSAKNAFNVDSFETFRLNGNPFMVYQKPVVVQNQLIGFLQLAVWTGHEEELLSLLRSILIISATIMVLMATTFGLFLARKSIAPIGKVIEAADQIQKGSDLSVRIAYDGPQDEIGQLINTVNNMLGRMEGFYKNLEDSYAAQRRFVSDASHELRTPLTTIRGNVDLLQRMWSKDDGSERPNLDEATMHQMTLEAVSDIADESKRMSRLVSDMLSLARADTGRTFEKQPVPLEILVEEVARRAKMLPRTAEWITGDFSILNGVYVNGNKDYMQQMLFIFIENAFKYTPEGQVVFDAFIYKNQVGIRISDTGIGMDKEEVPHIFERFYRADQSRGVTEGIGLGLSIAKWIIDELEGSVEVVTRLGEGTTFVIWLPIVFPTPLE
ncbi:HAMP domain-containing sensor histidine kinase [Paenibacillus sp. VCA1]|uniref:sensor histidine kinase n=1 Tax=Paenibacillus sp. VCA1 TaxID=3039148 RepID=UPI0028721ECF|nr:HAMP domain-containing sensor histidine kinase [Paenibacillus sp. VCA1]MDR9856889.1 HAMP domain-containing sensor histidine kinase [Paenibacillus sp. VCA1]